MPSAKTRITHIIAKPSSLASPLILESCSAMPRPRVPLSTLERVSACPTIRAPPRSQPLPATARLTTQVPKLKSERAAYIIERVKARSIERAVRKQPADLEARLAGIEERCAARLERKRQLDLKPEKGKQRQGK